MGLGHLFTPWSFMLGPHGCIARYLATHELRYVLSRIVLTMDVHPAESLDPIAFRGGVHNMRTTILKEHVLVTVKRRAKLVDADF